MLEPQNSLPSEESSEIDISIQDVSWAIQSHYKSVSVTAGALGILLPIIYCSEIKFYPSGLTIADTLFFVWAIIVFGFFYLLVAGSFFVASLFYVGIGRLVINLVRKIRKSKKRPILIATFINTPFILIGLIANLLLLVVCLNKHLDYVAMWGTVAVIACIYAIAEASKSSPSKKATVVEDTEELEHPIDPDDFKRPENSNDSEGQNPNPRLSPRTWRSISYLIIFFMPILMAGAGGGVIYVAFETMGIRQLGVNISFEAKNYQWQLDRYRDQGLASNYVCDTICELVDIDVLFTNIGSNTLVKLKGGNGTSFMIISTKDILTDTKVKLNPPQQSLESIRLNSNNFYSI